MRTSQTLQLEASEKRSELAAVTEKLNAAATAGTDPAAEDTGKAETLTKEIRGIEVRYRASVLEEDAEDAKARAAGDVDAETSELIALETRSQVSRYIGAAIDKRTVDGAEGEYNAALKMGAHAFPLRLLAPKLETRATTGTDTATTPVRWLDRLFSESAAARLGATMESVAPGVASFPVTTAGASAAQRGKEQAVADAAWTIGVTELKPTRNGVRALFTREDQLRVPGLEDALRRDLSAALMEGVDRVIFLGDNTANPNDGDIVGFVGAAVGEQTITQANKLKGSESLAAFTGLIDGKHAGSLGEMNVVAAVGAARLWESTALPAPVTTGETLAAYLRKAGLSWMARGDIETATANGDFAAFVGLTRGISGAAVAPVWESAQLIVDPYSGAAKGEVALTLSYFWNFAIPRTSNFKRLKFVA